MPAARELIAGPTLGPTDYLGSPEGQAMMGLSEYFRSMAERLKRKRRRASQPFSK